MSSIAIAKSLYGETGPGWIPSSTRDGKVCKPVIRCQCGAHIGLKLHHLHADGTVTASFFHATADQLQKDEQGYFFTHNGKKYHTNPGCGWHVFLKLKDWSGEDFPGEE